MGAGIGDGVGAVVEALTGAGAGFGAGFGAGVGLARAGAVVRAPTAAREIKGVYTHINARVDAARAWAAKARALREKSRARFALYRALANTRSFFMCQSRCVLRCVGVPRSLFDMPRKKDIIHGGGVRSGSATEPHDLFI